jgi:orotidine-5'-phosphate decarboxylase
MTGSISPARHAPRDARARLIVALDNPSVSEALNLVNLIGDEALFYKVGWRLFLQGGLGLVSELRDEGKDVFLDLKMDDIGETIQTAIEALGDEAMFLTLSGSPATCRAAVRGRGERAFPKFLFVTMLSSQNDEDLREMLALGGQDRPDAVSRYILHRAERAVEAGADGLICSGDSIREIREKLGPEPLLVCPGIRPAGSSADDHKRSATPREAIASGADYLVVGRPIRLASDPRGAVAQIKREIEAGIAARMG